MIKNLKERSDFPHVWSLLLKNGFGWHSNGSSGFFLTHIYLYFGIGLYDLIWVNVNIKKLRYLLGDSSLKWSFCRYWAQAGPLRMLKSIPLSIPNRRKWSFAQQMWVRTLTVRKERVLLFYCCLFVKSFMSLQTKGNLCPLQCNPHQQL